MSMTTESTIERNQSEQAWDHWIYFSTLLSEIGELSARVHASVVAAKDAPRAGAEFHRVMFELRSQLAAMKTDAEKFEAIADEYERGVHRGK